MTKIKPGDYVLVNGEGNQAFFVIGIDKRVVSLSNGAREPIEKCRKIPKRLHKNLFEIIQCYLDPEGIDEWLKRRKYEL